METTVIMIIAFLLGALVGVFALGFIKMSSNTATPDAPTIDPPTFDEAQGTPQPADNINPAHYRQHPAGCQCISVIRHYQCNVAMAIKYLWRAGLKQEQGLTRQAKMIEDLEKALWYMNDCASYLRNNKFHTCSSTKLYEDFIATTGYNPTDIVKGFDAKIQPIISRMLCTGFIASGNLKCVENAEQIVCEAIFLLGEYIEELEKE